MAESANAVFVTGKISRVGRLRYTPAGVPVVEFEVAVNQKMLGVDGVGYYAAMASGELAEDLSPELKIGKRVTIEGQLWTRVYKNRQGAKISEVKIVIEKLGG